jgi:hypothetical protein
VARRWNGEILRTGELHGLDAGILSRVELGFVVGEEDCVVRRDADAVEDALLRCGFALAADRGVEEPGEER